MYSSFVQWKILPSLTQARRTFEHDGTILMKDDACIHSFFHVIEDDGTLLINDDGHGDKCMYIIKCMNV